MTWSDAIDTDDRRGLRLAVGPEILAAFSSDTLVVFDQQIGDGLWRRDLDLISEDFPELFTQPSVIAAGDLVVATTSASSKTTAPMSRPSSRPRVGSS